MRRAPAEDTPGVGLWQANHSYFQQEIVGYQIVSRDTVGQTTTAVVRYDLASNYATCITYPRHDSGAGAWRAVREQLHQHLQIGQPGQQ